MKTEYLIVLIFFLTVCGIIIVDSNKIESETGIVCGGDYDYDYEGDTK